MSASPALATLPAAVCAVDCNAGITARCLHQRLPWHVYLAHLSFPEIIIGHRFLPSKMQAGLYWVHTGECRDQVDYAYYCNGEMQWFGVHVSYLWLTCSTHDCPLYIMRESAKQLDAIMHAGTHYCEGTITDFELHLQVADADIKKAGFVARWLGFGAQTLGPVQKKDGTTAAREIETWLPKKKVKAYSLRYLAVTCSCIHCSQAPRYQAITQSSQRN